MQKVICACDHIGVDTPEQVSPTSAIPALQARGMSLVGISDAGHGYSMRRPRPPYGHVLVTLRGSGMVWTDGRWVECGLGDAYLSPPYATSAFETRASKRWNGLPALRASWGVKPLPLSDKVSTPAPSSKRTSARTMPPSAV